MKKLLQELFSSDSFWNKFKCIEEQTTGYSYSANYKLISEYDNIQIQFYELKGVKSFTVIHSGRRIIDSMFFINFDELNLILHRIPQIRAANPLCSGPLSIVALSSMIDHQSISSGESNPNDFVKGSLIVS